MVLKPSVVLRRVKAGKMPSSIRGGRYKCERCKTVHVYETESPEFHENGSYVYCGRCKRHTLYRAIFPACEGYPEGFEISLRGERKKYPLTMKDDIFINKKKVP